MQQLMNCLSSALVANASKTMVSLEYKYLLRFFRLNAADPCISSRMEGLGETWGLQ
jgi:hypothetical protein